MKTSPPWAPRFPVVVLRITLTFALFFGWGAVSSRRVAHEDWVTRPGVDPFSWTISTSNRNRHGQVDLQLWYRDPDGSVVSGSCSVDEGAANRARLQSSTDVLVYTSAYADNACITDGVEAIRALSALHSWMFFVVSLLALVLGTVVAWRECGGRIWWAWKRGTSFPMAVVDAVFVEDEDIVSVCVGSDLRGRMVFSIPMAFVEKTSRFPVRGDNATIVCRRATCLLGELDSSGAMPKRTTEPEHSVVVTPSQLRGQLVMVGVALALGLGANVRYLDEATTELFVADGVERVATEHSSWEVRTASPRDSFRPTLTLRYVGNDGDVRRATCVVPVRLVHTLETLTSVTVKEGLTATAACPPWAFAETQASAKRTLLGVALFDGVAVTFLIAFAQHVRSQRQRHANAQRRSSSGEVGTPVASGTAQL